MPALKLIHFIRGANLPGLRLGFSIGGRLIFDNAVYGLWFVCCGLSKIAYRATAYRDFRGF